MCKKERWKPSISIPNLFKRAAIIKKIRCFFADRGVIEVDTPIMSHATTTDIHLSPFKTHFIGLNSSEEYDLWLTTSPEYHMKRLLAAGSGSIYQLSHGFRNGESGPYHNPEFTILEWYRIDYDLHNLMNEVNVLLETILHFDTAELISYQQVFIHYLSLDPLSADKEQLFEALKNLGAGNLIKFENDHDELLKLLFMIGIEPQIGIYKPIFVYHFPASQALLAEINKEDHRIAERFEVYYKGIELANGFCELTDSNEQWHRFEKDCSCRAERGLPQYPIDKNLLDALTHGMPACSGVALGLDRLLMLALKVNSINEVITFPIDRC